MVASIGSSPLGRRSWLCCNADMLIGYMRVSTTDQSTDLQRDALIAAGVNPEQLYSDKASGKRDDRPGLEACLKALRAGDTLVVWKLDRLGRSLRHLVATVQDLVDRGVGFKVLTGHGADIADNLQTPCPCCRLCDVKVRLGSGVEFGRNVAKIGDTSILGTEGVPPS